MTGAPISPRVRTLLLAATAAVGIGMSLLAWQTTAIGSLLFMNHGVPHDRSVLVEKVLAWFLVATVAALAVSRLRAIAAMLILLVALVLAWANVDQAGYPFSRFAFVAHALRIAAPLALIVAFVPLAGRENLRRPAVVTLLLAATVATFVVHGIEALSAHPWFTDLTLGAFNSVGLGGISQRAAEHILIAVGVVDLVAALALVVLRRPWIAGWMAFWGLFTALLRPLNYGAGALGEFIVRLPHVLIPIALILLSRAHAALPARPATP